jgi:nucleoside-diphosphate-sugar epimerase
MIKNILITGASGFIGSSLIFKISNLFPNSRIFCTYNKKLYYKKKNIYWIKTNLINKNFNRNFPRNIDLIIHLAADPRTFLKGKAARLQYKLNTLMTSNITEYAILSKCKYFIFASSVYVYSGSKNKIFCENEKLNPKESLGKSKKVSEKIIQNKFLNKKIKTFILRFFTVYGANSRKSQFLRNFLYELKRSRKKFVILNNVISKRDYIYIDDIIDLLILLIKKMKKIKKTYNIYNVGFGKSYSPIDILKIINKSFRKNFIIKSAKKKLLTSDISHLADISKIDKDLKWKPKFTIYRGLSKIYNQI